MNSCLILHLFGFVAYKKDNGNCCGIGLWDVGISDKLIIRAYANMFRQYKFTPISIATVLRVSKRTKSKYNQYKLRHRHLVNLILEFWYIITNNASLLSL